jgi:hypothetical protein
MLILIISVCRQFPTSFWVVIVNIQRFIWACVSVAAYLCIPISIKNQPAFDGSPSKAAGTIQRRKSKRFGQKWSLYRESSLKFAITDLAIPPAQLNWISFCLILFLLLLVSSLHPSHTYSNFRVIHIFHFIFLWKIFFLLQWPLLFVISQTLWK